MSGERARVAAGAAVLTCDGLTPFFRVAVASDEIDRVARRGAYRVGDLRQSRTEIEHGDLR